MTMAHMRCIPMVSLTAGMLGLPCRPCLGPPQLVVGDYYFVVAILGFICCVICISGYALPFLMWSFALSLSGNCPGGAETHFIASESWRSTPDPNYYPPFKYKFIVQGS